MSIANQYRPAENGIAARALAAQQAVSGLPALVQRAANQFASAISAAETLEAAEMASVAYDASKKAARLAKAKGAHDELIAKAHRAQADALEIEAAAKRRLADEYDAAQDRNEIAGHGGDRSKVGVSDLATVADIGLTKQDIHEARLIRDAEQAQPGIVRETLEAKLAAGEEPTKAALREAVIEAAKQGLRGGGQSTSKKNPIYEAPTEAGKAWSHIYGTCRAFAEWATPENLQLAVSGRYERRDDQSRNIAAVQRAVAALADFERMLDAQ